MARQRRPDVITLDIQMTGMDGWDALSALKAEEVLHHMILSVVDDKSRGFNLGASEYLIKPVGRDDLLSVVTRFCSGRAPGFQAS